jgi:hypothetical protein
MSCESERAVLRALARVCAAVLAALPTSKREDEAQLAQYNGVASQQGCSQQQGINSSSSSRSSRVYGGGGESNCRSTGSSTCSNREDAGRPANTRQHEAECLALACAWRARYKATLSRGIELCECALSKLDGSSLHVDVTAAVP